MRRKCMMTPYKGSIVGNIGISDIFEGLTNLTRMIENDLLTNSNIFGGENINIYVDNDGYHIEMALPGIDKDNIDVSLINDTIKVKVDKKDENEIKDRNYIYKEFSIEKIEREFKIPDGFDLSKLNVTYENGILKFDIPVENKVDGSNIKKIEIK